MSCFLFSDLHGNYDAWNLVRAELEPQIPANQVICLGDLIDRGSSSCQIVMEFAQMMQRYPNNCFFVLGNHEFVLQRLLRDFLAELDMPPSRVLKRADFWLESSGVTVLLELLRRPKLFTYEFLIAFAKLICYGFSKCYIRAQYLYSCTHAGVSDEEKGVLEDDHGHNAKRVFSRADNPYSGKIQTQEWRRKCKKRVPLNNERLNAGHRKYYVFGHTPTDWGIITTRWNYTGEYNYLFLPIDAGLAYADMGKDGAVAIAEIGPNIPHPAEEGVNIPHRVALHGVRGASIPYSYEASSVLSEETIMEMLNRIRVCWKEVWENLSPMDQALFVSVLDRSFAISWVPHWIKLLQEGKGIYHYEECPADCLLPEPEIMQCAPHFCPILSPLPSFGLPKSIPRRMRLYASHSIRNSDMEGITPGLGPAFPCDSAPYSEHFAADPSIARPTARRPVPVFIPFSKEGHDPASVPVFIPYSAGGDGSGRPVGYMEVPVTHRRRW